MPERSRRPALDFVRVCDLTGQLAGAGSTRYLAAVGAQVIRVEDPVRQGTWDVLRGAAPYVDERRGIEFGGAFNNHNVEKLGVTINLRTDAGKDLLRRLISESDVVCENFSAGVMERLGFGYETLRSIREDIIYVSNCGFGHSGPYRDFRSWGSIVQALSGLTFLAGLPDLPPAGWGYSYMDHHGGNFQAIAILAALLHRSRTGRGVAIDMACTEAAATMLGPTVLDYTVNGRGSRGPHQPHSNHGRSPLMVPHNIYPALGDDEWIAIACRDDGDWARLADVMGEPWCSRADLHAVTDRLAGEEQLDKEIGSWTCRHERWALAATLRSAGVPASAVARPDERIDGDEDSRAWGLWPTVRHPLMGAVRVDGLPIHFSETDWTIDRGAPLLGEHNGYVFGEILGLSTDEISALHQGGAI